MTIDIDIRPLAVTDAPAVATIFFEAVNLGTTTHYSATERRAWAGDAPMPEKWQQALDGVDGFVAEIDGQAVGFMTIDDTGYIDLSFVSPSHAGKGVGGRLLSVVEAKALEMGIAILTTEASRAARPFFARHGFELDCPQQVVRDGVTLEKFSMFKHLR